MFKLLQYLRVVEGVSVLISENLLRNIFYPTSSVSSILSALGDDRTKNVTKFVWMIDQDYDSFKLSLVSIIYDHFTATLSNSIIFKNPNIEILSVATLVSEAQTPKIKIQIAAKRWVIEQNGQRI